MAGINFTENGILSNFTNEDQPSFWGIVLSFWGNVLSFYDDHRFAIWSLLFVGFVFYKYYRYALASASSGTPPGTPPPGPAPRNPPPTVEYHSHANWCISTTTKRWNRSRQNQLQFLWYQVRTMFGFANLVFYLLLILMRERKKCANDFCSFVLFFYHNSSGRGSVFLYFH